MRTEKNTKEKPQSDTRAEAQSAPIEPNSSVPSAGVVWVRISPSQVIRTVVIALLTAAVVLGAFFLLWQVRSFIGWFVIALFLAAVLDLVPLVGATLGGALLVIVGLFVAPWKAAVLLVYIVIYQQVEGSILQPMVYSRAVQLNGLVIFAAPCR